MADGSNGFKASGKIEFDPPADWVAALPATGTQRFMLVSAKCAARLNAPATSARPAAFHFSALHSAMTATSASFH